MISVIFYGRNDYHGYNYHKRVALSLNCIAELLTDENDELIFVDYNTANDQPTVPQAIEDTLTIQAKDKIRILRVRPEQHHLYVKNASRGVSEPLARNIGIRRSNPANRWILSTNSDMIFVPHHPQQSLNHIVADLPEWGYGLPRFELPDYWWEASLSRIHPEEVIQLLKEQAPKLHLPMTVSHNDYLLYDNPGDFQLMPRKVLFDINGFNEAMRLGWHNDSNLCKRLSLYYQHNMKSLADRLAGYHCNHGRRTTQLHNKNRLENSWHQFVTAVDTPYLPEQPDWGWANIAVEEIRLSGKNSLYLQTIEKILSTCEPNHYHINMTRENYNHPAYYSAHVFPYLTDHLATLSKHTAIGYVGFNSTLLLMLVKFWQLMGYQGDIFCLNSLTPLQDNPSIKYVDFSTFSQSASLFIIDFGVDEENIDIDNKEQCWRQLSHVTKYFVRLAKQIKRGKNFERKFIGINTIYSDFKCIFDRHILTLDTSYNCNLTFGYIRKKNHCMRFKRYIKSTVHYYLCYWFPVFSWRLIGKLKGGAVAKHLFFADSRGGVGK